MSVIRVEHNRNYTVMSNYHFKETKMSLKAKGLLSFMLSLPEDWDYSVEGLTKCSSDGETAIRSALNELEEFGYLKRTKVYENGRISGIDYTVYEQPYKIENLNVENLVQENVVQENQGQLNTENNKITKGINKTNNIKNANFGFPHEDNIKLSTKTKKILNTIEKKILEYDIQDKVAEKIYEFYQILIDNKKMLSEQKINSDLFNLAKEKEDIQLQTVTEAINRGWQSLNPEWIKPKNKDYSYQVHSNSEASKVESVEEADERLKKMITNPSTKHF